MKMVTLLAMNTAQEETVNILDWRISGYPDFEPEHQQASEYFTSSP